MHQAPAYTRVVFDTNVAIGYRLFTLKNPDRVVIDLKSTRPASAFRPPSDFGTVVDAMRRAKRNDGAYRIVLDVNRVTEPKEFALPPVAPYGHRLVVDLYTGDPQRKKSSPRKPEGLREVVVAIDAGHGGEDPGASGPGRVVEKQVVMSIARKLAAQLDQTPGYRATLVREGDYYVRLRTRTAIAREQRADLLVSIHADAYDGPEVSGASVYVLSEKGASSETARWLAEKENRSDLIGGVGSVSLGDKDDLLASVLLDLSMDHNLSASIAVGEAVLASLSTVVQLHKKRVEQAGFAVLKAPDVPSILIETGYLSNPREAAKLKTQKYQREIAAAVADGITDYMTRNPPPDSWLAARGDRGSVRHVIKRGDTLSGIAARYHVSSRAIRTANGISGDVIKAGKVLTIPAPMLSSASGG
ncbi:MAG: N-acetylmuramoyl-L-alanine amidase [Gammaproteobacteria bacterium]|nr:N-acetylmuramoyl-L-alanine amidase [Gammaproteobacteria bacterium]